MPFSPTRAFSGALLPLPNSLGGSLNLLSQHITRQIVWQMYRPADKGVRQQVFDLPRRSFWGPFNSKMLNQAPILYGFSPSVILPPADWDPSLIHITGYWNLEPSDGWTPPLALTQFLESGTPPIYIGFGSMSNRKPEETADVVLQALKQTHQRAIVFTGWAGLQKADLPDTVMMVDSTPHSWLFQHVAAVVHHGGAGTTAAGLRSGVPSIVVPFHGDQPFWGRRVAELGVGPSPIPRSKLTAEKLSHAIQSAMGDAAMRQRAAELGTKIRAEDGIANAVAVIERLKLV